MSSAAFTCLELYLVKYHQTPHWIYWANGILAVFFLGLAAFLVWKDEHEKLVCEIEKNTNPILFIKIEEISVNPSHRSDVFVLASVRNDSKTDTLIETYWAVLSTEAGHTYPLAGPLTDTGAFIRNEVDWLNRPYRVTYTEKLKDLVSQISRQEPLRYGLPVRGWLHFKAEFNHDLPDLDADMITKFSLCMRDSCVGSVMHAVAKEPPFDNPNTRIEQAEVAV
jgi:hypothetical protein